MLSKEEAKASNQIARKIVGDCLLYGPMTAPSCIKERISGLTYILEVGKSLPQDHPINKQTGKISDIIDGIKQETFFIIAPER